MTRAARRQIGLLDLAYLAPGDRLLRAWYFGPGGSGREARERWVDAVDRHMALSRGVIRPFWAIVHQDPDADDGCAGRHFVQVRPMGLGRLVRMAGFMVPDLYTAMLMERLEAIRRADRIARLIAEMCRFLGEFVEAGLGTKAIAKAIQALRVAARHIILVAHPDRGWPEPRPPDPAEVLSAGGRTGRHAPLN